MKKSKRVGIRVFGGAAVLAAAGWAYAGDAAAPQDTSAVLRSELKDLLTRLAASGALEGGGMESAMAVSAPPVRVVTLGAVLDTSGNGRDGVAVLAVTPGGNAAALGLRSGDTVRAVNGESFAALSGTEAAAHLRRAVETGDGRVHLEVTRGGRPLALDGTMKPVLVPGYRFELAGTPAPGLNAGIAAATLANNGPGGNGGCGRISEFPTAPRSQKLYGAKILSIDGKLPGPKGQQNFRVPVGPHDVTLAENIDYRDLPIVHNRERRGSEKTIRVEVKADTTTIMASRLSEASAASGRGYWEPAVWKEIPEPCR
jgi:hypothetical protein